MIRRLFCQNHVLLTKICACSSKEFYMVNTFFKHFLVIGSGSLFSMLISFITTPIITRIVNPSEYGQFSIFTMYSNMALIVLCLGLDQSLVRFYFQKETKQYRRALLFKCLKYPIIGTFFATCTVLVLSVTGSLQFELGFPALILICVYTFIQIIYRFSLLLVRLQYKSKLYSLLGIVQKIIYIVLVMILLCVGLFSNVMSLAVATVSATLTCMIISFIAEKELWNPWLVKKNECIIPTKELICYAYPYIFSMGITSIFQYTDKISLNYYCSYEEVGIYSSAMTLVHVFSIIQTTFNTLWAPMAVEHYTQDEKDRSFYQKGNQVITVLMFFIGLSLIVVKDVFSVLLGEKYREAAYILPFLIFYPIMYTISETTVNGLVFMKKSKLQVVVALISCMINFLGNSILVPIYGGRGAAISTGLSYIVFFRLRTLLSNHFFYVDFKLKRFYLLTFIVCLYALYNTFIKFNAWVIVFYIVCLMILCLLYWNTIVWGANYIVGRIMEKFKKHKIDL